VDHFLAAAEDLSRHAGEIRWIYGDLADQPPGGV
jgi:hypothetical protein